MLANGLGIFSLFWVARMCLKEEITDFDEVILIVLVSVFLVLQLMDGLVS